MGYVEEVVDFIDDQLEGQAIWSNPVIGHMDVLWDSNKLHHLGSRPVEEATVTILGDFSQALGVQGVRTLGHIENMVT